MDTSFEPPVDRTPQELVAELRGLVGVDWETVWDGPPLPGQGLDEWCAQFGWTPTQFEYVLNVRTDAGGLLVLNAAGGSWAPVQSASCSVWGDVASEGPTGNRRLLDRAAEAWPLFRDAVSAVLGHPAWEGAWDSASFPEELGEYTIPCDRDRLEDQSPFRIAYWELSSQGDALARLTVTPSVGTAQGSQIGTVDMSLDVYPRPLKGGRR